MDLTDRQLDVLTRLYNPSGLRELTSDDIGTRRSIFRTLTDLSKKGLVLRDQGPGWHVTKRGGEIVREGWKAAKEARDRVEP